VYSNSFDARAGTQYPEWTASKLEFSSRARPQDVRLGDARPVTNTESRRGNVRFLGEFGGGAVDPKAQTRAKQTVSLALKDLPPHQMATVSFDLLILKSWDGNSPQYGPDRWKLSVRGGQTLLDTTFSNNPKLKTDKGLQDYPRPGSQPKTDAKSVNTMGYGFFGDSTYRFEFSFPHHDDSLTLDFSSDLFEGKGTEDESWGLDNVKVSTAPPRGERCKE
jgi:hypothetical protein